MAPTPVELAPAGVTAAEGIPLVNRVSTGVPGLDALIGGGIPSGSAVLLLGTPGTGKSIFGLQYLYSGAQSGQSGLYVSFEQTPDELRKQALLFGWDFEPLEKISRIAFLRIPVDEPVVDVFTLIEQAAKSVSAERIVIDSLGILAINSEIYALPLLLSQEEAELKYRTYKTREKVMLRGSGENKTQRLVYLFVRKLKALGTTTLFVGDAVANDGVFSRDGVSEYAVDGVIALRNLNLGQTVYRSLEVRKMRFTSHAKEPFTYEITPRGIEIEKTTT